MQKETVWPGAFGNKLNELLFFGFLFGQGRADIYLDFAVPGGQPFKERHFLDFVDGKQPFFLDLFFIQDKTIGIDGVLIVDHKLKTAGVLPAGLIEFEWGNGNPLIGAGPFNNHSLSKGHGLDKVRLAGAIGSIKGRCPQQRFLFFVGQQMVFMPAVGSCQHIQRVLFLKGEKIFDGKLNKHETGSCVRLSARNNSEHYRDKISFYSFLLPYVFYKIKLCDDNFSKLTKIISFFLKIKTIYWKLFLRTVL